MVGQLFLAERLRDAKEDASPEVATLIDLIWAVPDVKELEIEPNELFIERYAKANTDEVHDRVLAAIKQAIDYEPAHEMTTADTAPSA